MDEKRPSTSDATAYEPPRVTVLGALSDLTKGHRAVHSDGISPGSLIQR